MLTQSGNPLEAVSTATSLTLARELRVQLAQLLVAHAAAGILHDYRALGDTNADRPRSLLSTAFRMRLPTVA